ncbi:MAG TPA: CopG family transcriptional regulator [Pseudonocardia sp.]|nr:CopG family transcriptional regulator [Pseudonocardia sp.]
MRTTVTLDPDTAALVQRLMRERGISFKQAVNDAIRRGAAAPATTPFRTEPADLGVPSVNLDRALLIAGELEDEELLRKIRAGK